MTLSWKFASRLSVKCGISRRQATRRASARSSMVQHPPYVVSDARLRLSYICIDSPMTSCPCNFSRYAAVEESTPPDIATAIFISCAVTGHIGHNSSAVATEVPAFSVLVVDDDPNIRRMIVAALRRDGYSFFE